VGVFYFTTKDSVRWNHVSDHALTVLGIAPPELYINPLQTFFKKRAFSTRIPVYLT
jgi:hypothetical protein